MPRDRFPVVVHVLLLRHPAAPATQREIFLLRRAGTGFMDGYHVPPGGHLEAGESVHAAARRECREETGAEPAILRPACVLAYRSGRHQGFNFVFTGEQLQGTPGVGEPERCAAADWYPLGALPDPLAPWLTEALDLLGQADRPGPAEWFRELYWP